MQIKSLHTDYAVTLTQAEILHLVYEAKSAFMPDLESIAGLSRVDYHTCVKCGSSYEGAIYYRVDSDFDCPLLRDKIARTIQQHLDKAKANGTN